MTINQYLEKHATSFTIDIQKNKIWKFFYKTRKLCSHNGIYFVCIRQIFYPENWSDWTKSTQPFQKKKKKIRALSFFRIRFSTFLDIWSWKRHIQVEEIFISFQNCEKRNFIQYSYSIFSKKVLYNVRCYVILMLHFVNIFHGIKVFTLYRTIFP